MEQSQSLDEEEIYYSPRQGMSYEEDYSLQNT